MTTQSFAAPPDLTPRFSVSIDLDHREIHQRCSGFWTEDTIRMFEREMIETARPLLESNEPFRCFADLSDFPTQDRNIGAMMHASFNKGVAFGLERVAVVSQSTLFKMQYRRISAGVETEFFETRMAALDWLRSKARQAG